jgi:dihydrofolate reductase
MNPRITRENTSAKRGSIRSVAGTQIIGRDLAAELTKLKQPPGRDIAILGSSSLTVSLMQLGLVDEVRIMVSPVVLGYQPAASPAGRQ